MGILSSDDQKKFLEKLSKVTDTLDLRMVAKRVDLDYFKDVKPTLLSDPEFRGKVLEFFEGLYWSTLENLYHTAQKHDGYNIHLQSALSLIKLLKSPDLLASAQPDLTPEERVLPGIKENEIVANATSKPKEIGEDIRRSLGLTGQSQRMKRIMDQEEDEASEESSEL